MTTKTATTTATTTRTSIKKLLMKKKLTGEEVGRLMILDLVEAYKKRLAGEYSSEGLLTPEEKNNLVNRVFSSNDVRVYNAFRDIHSFMITTQTFILMYASQAELYFSRLFSAAKELYHAELNKQAALYQPVIMTQAQYDTAKQADFAHKMAQKVSAQDIILHAAEYYAAEYDAGEQTPDSALFDTYQTQPIGNPRITSLLESESMSLCTHNAMPAAHTNVASPQVSAKRATVVQKAPTQATAAQTASPHDCSKQALSRSAASQTRSKVAASAHTSSTQHDASSDFASADKSHDQFTMLDSIRHASLLYGEHDAKQKSGFAEFEHDFPEFTTTLLKKLTLLPGLSDITNSAKDSADKKAFAVKDLYENNILGYRDIVDTLSPQGCNTFNGNACVGTIAKGNATNSKAASSSTIAMDNNSSDNVDTIAKGNAKNARHGDSANGKSASNWDSASSGFNCGVAVLQDQPLRSPHMHDFIDEHVNYCGVSPQKISSLIGEASFAQQENNITIWRSNIKKALAECFARERAIDLVGDFIDVPDVRIFYASHEGIRERMTSLNHLFSTFLSMADATVAESLGQSSTNNKYVPISERVQQYFTPIDVDALEPTPEAMESARQTLCYEIFQGGSDEFIESIKREVQE